jgi:flagellar biosynthesis/type III secretory pathway protein FliH
MESKFKIVEEEEYIFAVSDEEIKKGDCHRFTCFDGDIIKKIIAYQPKGNAPELDLPLLPDVEDDTVEKLAESYYTQIRLAERTAFKFGYKAATKVYSEEDLRKAYNKGFSEGVIKGTCSMVYKHESFEEYIQSLKQPKWFVAEMKHTKSEVFRENDNVPYAVLKTTTIKNKIYLEGTYLN